MPAELQSKTEISCAIIIISLKLRAFGMAWYVKYLQVLLLKFKFSMH